MVPTGVRPGRPAVASSDPCHTLVITGNPGNQDENIMNQFIHFIRFKGCGHPDLVFTSMAEQLYSV